MIRAPLNSARQEIHIRVRDTGSVELNIRSLCDSEISELDVRVTTRIGGMTINVCQSTSMADGTEILPARHIPCSAQRTTEAGEFWGWAQVHIQSPWPAAITLTHLTRKSGLESNRLWNSTLMQKAN